MRAADRIALSVGALREHRLRTFLSVLGIAVGIGMVILMTSLGEGARLYVGAQFRQFGTNLLQINPGRSETFGMPGALGGTTHHLTIDDAEALRRVQGVELVVPATMGQARVAAGERGRHVYVFGVNHEAPEVWKIDVRQGEFLPEGDPRRGAPVAVLAPKLARELFGEESPLGEWVRVAGRRLRVCGVMEPKGQLLGFDMDDVAYVPVATGMQLFDLEELTEIDVTFAHEGLTDAVVAGIRRVLTARHGGEEDFTITTQAGMLDVFDDVMNVVAWGVVAIAAVSLLVGAIGILTVTWIAVGERTHEIGLLRALGATVADVRDLFLIEAAALATLGGLAGLAGGWGLARVLALLLPELPVTTPPLHAALALAVSLASGLLAGLAPASRAAHLEPVAALRAE